MVVMEAESPKSLYNANVNVCSSPIAMQKAFLSLEEGCRIPNVFAELSSTQGYEFLIYKGNLPYVG